MTRLTLLAAALASLVACGGTPTSTLPASLPTRGLSESESRVLSVLPDDILLLSTFDVSRLRAEALTEPQVTILEAAVPFARAVRRVHVAIGDYRPLERMCLSGPLAPNPDGCPEAPERDPDGQTYYVETPYDESDALASYRQGAEGQVFAFYVAFEATPEACAALVGDATESGGRRVRRQSGAGLVDLGDGVCVFTSSSLVDRVRALGGDVVASAAQVRARSAPSFASSVLELTLSPERVEPFFASWEATGASSVPRFDIALRSRLHGLLTASLSAGSREERFGVGVSLRYELGEQPIGTEALPRLVQDVYAAIRAMNRSRDSDLDWLENMRIDRTEHELALDIPLSSDNVRDLLQDTLRTMSRTTRVDIPSEYDPVDYAPQQRLLEQSATEIEPLSPQEALLAIERFSAGEAASDAEVALALGMRRVLFLWLTGRFEDAKTAASTLLADGLCTSVTMGSGLVPYDEREVLLLVLRQVVVGADAMRNDVATYESTTESLADAPSNTVCLSLQVVRDATERLLAAFQGRVDPTDPAAPSLRPTFDRFPTTVFTPVDARLFALARLGRFTEIRAIVQHSRATAPDNRDASLRYYGALAAIETGHALEVLEGADVLPLERESAGPEDEYTPYQPAGWAAERVVRIDDADRAWLRCRAERRAHSDAAALDACRVALTRALRAHGPVHPNVARAHVELGEALLGARRRDEARAEGRAALGALTSVHESHPLFAAARRLGR